MKPECVAMGAPASDIGMHSPSSPPVSTKLHRRIRVHRRHRLPFYRTRSFRILCLFFVLGFLVDFFHPRLNSTSISSAASSSDLSVLQSYPACASRLSGKESIPSRWTVLSLHSGGFVRESIVCWTPAETVSVLHLPGTGLTVLPASWAVVSWIPLNGSASLKPLSRVSIGFRGRFRPHFVDMSGAPSMVLEHARGFIPARMLQRAVLEVLIMGTPLPLLRYPVELGSELVRYMRVVLIPSTARAVLGSATVLFTALDRPFATAREFAEKTRKRRVQE